MTRHAGVGRFDLDQRGLARLLGTLEAEVMEIAWKEPGDLTIREVVDQIRLTRPIAFNTVMTVMNRLVDKGLLERTPGKSAYRYKAAQTKEKFLQAATERVTRGLVEDFQVYAVGHFVDVLDEVNPDILDQLARLVEQKKRAREQEQGHGR